MPPPGQNIHMLLSSPAWELLNVSSWSIFTSQIRGPMIDSQPVSTPIRAGCPAPPLKSVFCPSHGIFIARKLHVAQLLHRALAHLPLYHNPRTQSLHHFLSSLFFLYSLGGWGGDSTGDGTRDLPCARSCYITKVYPHPSFFHFILRQNLTKSLVILLPQLGFAPTSSVPPWHFLI